MVVKLQNGEELVAKVSAKPYVLEVERLILQHLHNHRDGLPIPKIAETPQLELGNTVCAPGSELVCCNLFEREFAGVAPTHITADMLCALWDTLAVVHSLGVVHCDLRAPNIAYDPQRRVLVLLDWGASRVYDVQRYPHALQGGVVPPVMHDKLYQRGGLITASPAVRKYICSTGDERRFHCLPADEAMSMIYLTFQLLLPDESFIHDAPANAKEAAAHWQMFEEDYFGDDHDNPIAVATRSLQDGDARTSASPAAITAVVHATIRRLFTMQLQPQTGPRNLSDQFAAGSP